ncbi:MAG: TrmH family RNA methyltransferase [Pyrinomonadaceae bacterium]
MSRHKTTETRGGVITSRANALVREARAVRDGKTKALIFVEGVRLCEEAARSGVIVEDLLYTEKIARDERGAGVVESMGRAARRAVAVTEEVLASVSDTKTPQGVVALARRPQTDASALDKNRGEVPLIVVLNRVNNPSNAGAMLRVAEAAGATGAITTGGSADVFSPKALRGAMGSSFRLPVWAGADFSEVVAWCAAKSVRTVAADARATKAHTEIDWSGPRAVIVGAEGPGLDAADAAGADVAVRIPMRAPVESLNVAVALAVILYEAVRQRSGV